MIYRFLKLPIVFALMVDYMFDYSTIGVPSLLYPGLRDTSFTMNSATQLENFPFYIRSKFEYISSSIIEELQQIKFKKFRIYSDTLVIYTLMLRYTLISQNVARKLQIECWPSIFSRLFAACRPRILATHDSSS